MKMFPVCSLDYMFPDDRHDKLTGKLGDGNQGYQSEIALSAGCALRWGAGLTLLVAAGAFAWQQNFVHHMNDAIVGLDVSDYHVGAFTGAVSNRHAAA